MQLRDQPRPSGYKPNTPNQFREDTVDDCTWYAMEYGFERASKGKFRAPPVEIRKTFDPDATGPTRLSDALSTTHLFFKSRNDIHSVRSPDYPIRFREAIRLLKQGTTLVVAGDYEALPFHYRRWTRNDTFDHAIACHSFDPTIKYMKDSIGSTFMYDPLGGGPGFLPYDGEWIPVESLFLDFAWMSEGNLSMVALYPFPEERMITMPTIYNELPYIVRIKPNAEVRRAPDPLSPTIPTDKKELGVFGYVRNDNDWKAVMVFVPGMLEATSHPALAYVHESDVVETMRNPNYDGIDELKAQLKKAKTELQNVKADVKDTLKLLLETLNG